VTPRAVAKLLALVVLAVAALGVNDDAAASPGLRVGIMDDAQVLGHPTRTFDTLGVLRPDIVRVNLWWNAVATRRPRNGANHEDQAYTWGTYDAVVMRASRQRIRVLFTIVGTPRWANGGRTWNHPPTRMRDLRSFALAASQRYSGTYTVETDADTFERLPRVAMWTAWNEPNLPIFFRPRTGPWSPSGAASAYARVCNAVVAGVHAGQSARAGEKVACGVTAPYGGSGVRPLRFLRLLKRFGARFDVYAHHPHPGSRDEPPSARPRSNEAIRLGNIDVLIGELTRLYGRKRLWITEFGYQTNPPDRYGVSWTRQARYLTQAYAIASRNPRIDMMVWFLLRDQDDVDGWQSGLISADGRRKPAFDEFEALADGP
jgi:hypothetical protein